MIAILKSKMVVAHKLLLQRGIALTKLINITKKENNKKEIERDIQAQGLKIGNNWLIKEDATTQDLVFEDVTKKSMYSMVAGKTVKL